MPTRCAPEKLSLPSNAIRPAMMSFFGALLVLLGDGVDDGTPAAAAGAEVLPAATVVDDPADDFDVPLEAAGFDEVQAAASTTTAAVAGRMRQAGHPLRTSRADRALWPSLLMGTTFNLCSGRGQPQMPRPRRFAAWTMVVGEITPAATARARYARRSLGLPRKACQLDRIAAGRRARAASAKAIWPSILA